MLDLKRLLPGVFFCLLVGSLISCSPNGKKEFDALAKEFRNLPPGFTKATTAVFWSTYEENLITGRFSRVTAWAPMPDKMITDGKGQYTVAAAVLKQEETSDGPVPDVYLPFLVRVVRDGKSFRLVPNEIFSEAGIMTGWHDEAQRTVHFRGVVQIESKVKRLKTVWEFRGRY